MNDWRNPVFALSYLKLPRPAHRADVSVPRVVGRRAHRAVGLTYETISAERDAKEAATGCVWGFWEIERDLS